MSIIQLKHNRKLGYVGGGKMHLLPLPRSVELMRSYATVVTFRPCENNDADEIMSNVDALTRLNRLPIGDVVFYSVESDSPLAPLLFWDSAHSLRCGNSISVIGDTLSQDSYLSQEYFSAAFIVEKNDSSGTVFRKVKPLPAETNKGLDKWTFGIPVGPEDATLLNVAVRRILELNIEEKEILLCGRPGKNFLYWDQVRIVGEDITAPPVLICSKKNRLAQEAKYENLCIMHDRIFLPKDFDKAVKEFGDFYPLTAFQSVYFDDKWNLVPRRYSDFGVAPKVAAQVGRGLMRDNDAKNHNRFAPAVLAIAEGNGYYAGNPMRHSRSHYPTGSLYLCKRSVWLMCPQDEDIHWAEFEDLEHASRADKMGIPSRINPYAITQSLIGRPLLSTYGAVFYENTGGGYATYRPYLETLKLPRKPLIKILNEQAQSNLVSFARKYVPESVAASMSSNIGINSRVRMGSILQVTHRMKLPLRHNAIAAMLADYEKHIVLDQLPFSWRETAAKQFLEHGSEAVSNLGAKSGQLLNHVTQRYTGRVFAKSLLDYLPSNKLVVHIGSFISAALIGRQHKRAFYLSGNVFTRYRQIIDSTPFIEYAKEIAK